MPDIRSTKPSNFVLVDPQCFSISAATFIRGWRCTGGRSHGPTHGAPQAGDQLPPPAPRGRGWSGGFGRVSGQSGVPRGGGSKVRLDFGGCRSDSSAKLLLRRWYREGIGVRADLGGVLGVERDIGSCGRVSRGSGSREGSSKNGRSGARGFGRVSEWCRGSRGGVGVVPGWRRGMSRGENRVTAE